MSLMPEIFNNFMAEVVNTQIMSSKVGQVNEVGKVLGQKFDDGV